MRSLLFLLLLAGTVHGSGIADAAEDVAGSYSRGKCWRYVKTALLQSGIINKRPTTIYAREAGYELQSKFGFVRLGCGVKNAPIGAVIVYGGGIGHVEIKIGRNKFASDYIRVGKPLKRPLIGVFYKS